MERHRRDVLATAVLALAVAACGDAGAPLPAEPWDVTSFVRLTASATGGLPWPREAEDAAATVRDDEPVTTWKAPLDEPSFLELDLQPARSDRSADEALLRRLPTIFDGHGGGRVLQDRVLEASIDDLAGELAAGNPPRLETLAALQDRLAMLAGLPSEAHHSGLDPDLVDELQFPLRKARLVGLSGLGALALLVERLAGRDGDEAAARMQAWVDEAALQRFELSQGAPERLAASVLSVPAAPVAGVEGALEVADTPPCRAGEPWTWRPFTAADAVFISGLPGAMVQAGKVRFTPRHGGRYEGVVAGSGGTADGRIRSFGFREFRLACTP